MIAGVNAYYQPANAEIENVAIITPLEEEIPGLHGKDTTPLPGPTDILDILKRADAGLLAMYKDWGPAWYIQIKIRIRSFPKKSENMANILHASTGKSVTRTALYCTVQYRTILYCTLQNSFQAMNAVGWVAEYLQSSSDMTRNWLCLLIRVNMTPIKFS